MVKTTDTLQEYMLASTPFVGDASHFNFSHFSDCICITLVLICVSLIINKVVYNFTCPLTEQSLLPVARGFSTFFLSCLSFPKGIWNSFYIWASSLSLVIGIKYDCFFTLLVLSFNIQKYGLRHLLIPKSERYSPVSLFYLLFYVYK